MPHDKHFRGNTSGHRLGTLPIKRRLQPWATGNPNENGELDPHPYTLKDFEWPDLNPKEKTLKK